MKFSSGHSCTLTQLRIAVHGIGLAGTIAIPLAAYALLFSTNDRHAEEWSAAIKVDSEIVRQEVELIAEWENTESELLTLKQRLEELKAQIPNGPEESRFLAQLSKLAEEAELGIRNFRPGPAEDSNDVKRIRVKLSGVGSYECLCRFLDGLQSLPRLTHVTTLKIDPADSDGQYPVDMELSIFFAGNRAKTTKAARNG